MTQAVPAAPTARQGNGFEAVRLASPKAFAAEPRKEAREDAKGAAHIASCMKPSASISQAEKVCACVHGAVAVWMG
jgi:hypothetical protein